MGPPWSRHCDSLDLRNRLGLTDKEWALATASPCRPQTFPAGSVPLPLSSPSARRIDPLRGLRPPMPPASAPPFGLAVNQAFWKRALAPAAQRQRTARSGERFACESFDATATAQRAECLLRSTTRGPARSKVICARHAEGVASGHSLREFVRCRRREWALQAR